MFRAARWSDHDRYFGPFTWSYSDNYSHWALVLKSRGDDDVESGLCSLRITVRKTTLIIALPGIIRPHRERVYPKSWDAETVKRLGRDWYWNIDPRQYGFSLTDGHLNIYYGRWGCFLPWTQWRHVRHSLYGLQGGHFWTEPKGAKWEAYREAKDACPTVAFRFQDFDRQELVATTRIEEREWHFGTGWFKWLSLFCRAKVRRSLDIGFSGETGPEKGSWKGGTVGTGIDMLPGEHHEAAFRRYCNEEHRAKSGKYTVTFVSRVQPDDGQSPGE